MGKKKKPNRNNLYRNFFFFLFGVLIFAGFAIATTIVTDNVGTWTGNVTASYFIGDGSRLSNLNTSGISSTNVAFLNISNLFAFGQSINSTLNVTAGTSLTKARVGGVIFDNSTDRANSGTAETTLYLNPILANTLNSTNDKVYATFVGNFTGSGTATSQFKLYFNNTQIYDSGAVGLTTSGDFQIDTIIIRTGSTTAESVVTLTTPSASTLVYSDYTPLTGINFANAQTLNLTGTSAGVGAGSGLINGLFTTMDWRPGT